MEIKTLQPLNGGHHSYGYEYEVRVSESTALALVRREFPTGLLPRMGYGKTLRRYEIDSFLHLAVYLELQNRSGDYFVCCSTATIGEWPALFDVTVT